MKLQEVECECGRTCAGAIMASDVARLIQKAKHDAMMEAARIAKLYPRTESMYGSRYDIPEKVSAAIITAANKLIKP